MAHTHPLLESLFPRRRPDLAEQVRSLSRDIAHLARDVGRFAGPRVEEAAHTAGSIAGGVTSAAGDVMNQLAPLARDVARRARAAGRVVRDDPVPAIVAIGTFALVVSLILRRQ